MTNLGEHNGRKIVPAEAADLGPPSPAKESEEAENKEDGAAAPASVEYLHGITRRPRRYYYG